MNQKCTLHSVFNRGLNQHQIDFKLTDYRNSLFVSDSINSIMEFYNGFKSSIEVINWMKERPNGSTQIKEVEGDKEIIVVIPTIDSNGMLAQRCHNDVYPGLHIVFVESGLPKDYYFNFANSCNIGVKKALEYKPKWIICSNDDVFKIDDVILLRRELAKYDFKKIKSLIPESESQGYCFITSYNFLFRILSRFNLFRRFPSISLDLQFDIEYSVQCSLRSMGIVGKLLYIFLTKRVLKVFPSGQIRIVSSSFADSVNGNIYDNTYINGIEDFDLAIKLLNLKQPSEFINYRLGIIGGASLGNTYERFLRSAASRIYLDYKIKNGTLKILQRKLFHP